jgi:hypothetical protein
MICQAFKIIIILSLTLINVLTFAQPSINEKYKREAAFEAIKEMKYQGVLVVRLKTNHVKVKALENTLNQDLKDGKRKRIQSILDETLTKQNIMNQAMAKGFLDSFKFCPVYLSYDTSAKSLSAGMKKGIFLNREMQIDPSISIPDSAIVFVAYYHEKSGEYPTDGLMIRKLNKKLEEPFPNFTAVRESFVNDINAPRMRKAIYILDYKLRSLFARADKKSK